MIDKINHIKNKAVTINKHSAEMLNFLIPILGGFFTGVCFTLSFVSSNYGSLTIEMVDRFAEYSALVIVGLILVLIVVNTVTRFLLRNTTKTGEHLK